MGEAHADVLVDRLKTKYGVEVEQVPLRVPLRETITAVEEATKVAVLGQMGNRAMEVTSIYIYIYISSFLPLKGVCREFTR